MIELKTLTLLELYKVDLSIQYEMFQRTWWIWALFVLSMPVYWMIQGFVKVVK